MNRYAYPSEALTVPTTDSAPVFTVPEAEALARVHYDIEGAVKPLPSERDQNFLVMAPGQGDFVLKIANPREDIAVLEAQNAVMERIARSDRSLKVPQLRRSSTGEAIKVVTGPRDSHMVRMVTFLPGTALAESQDPPVEAFRATGNLLGNIDEALTGFSHPGVPKNFHWDLRHATTIIDRYGDLIPEAKRKLLNVFVGRFEQGAVPFFAELRTGVIHNDGNDHNVIVSQSGKDLSVGLVDLGDLVDSCMVFEPAVAAAYAMLYRSGSLAAARAVVNGYHNSYPLTALEASLLGILAPMRLCLSVVIGAFQMSRAPGNEYLKVSQAPAWLALEYLADLGVPQLRAQLCEGLDGI